MERLYCAKIWTPLTKEEKQNLTAQERGMVDYYRRHNEFIYEELLAKDGDDAEKKIIAKYGKDKSYSIWNEEDAHKPR